VSSASGSKCLLQLLRRETAEQHRKLERDLDLLRPGLDLFFYTSLLARFHRIYKSWEPLAERLVGPVFPDWPASRSRLGLIRQDLAVLGSSVPADQTIAFPDLTDGPAALGGMYVVEGSTLGSQFLMRHFQQTLGIGPSTGGAFFHGYGAETSVRWREFTEGIEAYAARTGTHDRVVTGARSMFGTMHRELCGEPA
jgi:heme oxygenase